MLFQMASCFKALAAVFKSAPEWAVARVHPEVDLEVGLLGEALATVRIGTNKGSLPGLTSPSREAYMRSLVDPESGQSGIPFSAPVAGVRLLSGVAQVMSLEVSISDEGLATVGEAADVGTLASLPEM